jgi:hypothetical protein
LYISRWVISVLMVAALGYGLVAPIRSQAAGSQAIASPAPGVLTVQVASGTVGSETVVISGHAPPFADVTLVVSGLVSADLPTLSIATVEISAARDGSYSTSVSLAPLYSRASRVTVKATLGNGIASATGSTLIAAPNAGNTVTDWDGSQ